ncbi:hypothetical protein LCGC14_1038650 [marine sediment metagenome]|uniref:Uncharacterized protein n=1 Tax=marine sediment metagenome TaxID=412755 RepID=A0A0F9NE33_9ZZZZ
MPRYFTPNRWNWSQKAEKWVYIELTESGNKKYTYQVEPPQEFIDLTVRMTNLNEKLLKATNPEVKEKIFNDLTKLSKKMQNMSKI